MLNLWTIRTNHNWEKNAIAWELKNKNEYRGNDAGNSYSPLPNETKIKRK